MQGINQYTLFLVFSALTGLGSLAAAIAGILIPKKIVFNTLRGCLFTQAGLVVVNALELIDPTVSGTIFWAKMTYLFFTFGIVLWFAFSLEYAGLRRWLSPDKLPLFFLMPLVTTLLAFTNDLHRLIWEAYSLDAVSGTPFLVMTIKSHGAWFWAWFVYAYAIFLIGVFLIVREFFRNGRRYVKQSAWVLVGAFFPIVLNSFYIFRLVPGWTKDYTSIAFALGGICAAIGTLNIRLLRSADIPRHELVERMAEGLLVLDANGTVVDINQAALARFGRREDALLGAPVESIFPDWRDALLPEQPGGDVDVELFVAPHGEKMRVRVSRMREKDGYPNGFYVVLDPRESTGQCAGPAPIVLPPMLPALIIDGNGTVIECGNLEPFDYLSGDITGGHISRIAIEAETFLRSLPSAAGDSDGCSAEIELKKKNGERVLASAGVSLIAGAPGRYLVILTDIRFTKDILSARELEIVACMRRGLLVKTIAAELNISENTVNTHIKNMFRKTGIRNKKDLLRKLSED